MSETHDMCGFTGSTYLTSVCGCQLLKGAIASLNDLVVDLVRRDARCHLGQKTCHWRLFEL